MLPNTTALLYNNTDGPFHGVHVVEVQGFTETQELRTPLLCHSTQKEPEATMWKKAEATTNKEQPTTDTCSIVGTWRSHHLNEDME